ncbi:MAG: CYTH domain-containing protein, partial [Betaproteobacteria bacterium]|nr:CYTH domain-containing protein [Betaproteobacteria bacterium]
MEIELKLAVSPTALNRLIRHPIWSSWRCSDSRQTLRSIYFDTANADLTAAGYALRLRRVGRRWVQTVKGGGGAGAGLHRRDEFESEVRGPQPDFTKMPDRLLDGVLADATVRGQL